MSDIRLGDKVIYRERDRASEDLDGTPWVATVEDRYLNHKGELFLFVYWPDEFVHSEEPASRFTKVIT